MTWNSHLINVISYIPYIGSCAMVLFFWMRKTMRLVLQRRPLSLASHLLWSVVFSWPFLEWVSIPESLMNITWIHSLTALTPVLINHLDNIGFLKKYPYMNAPIQTLFCGLVLIFATPMGCAFFSQRAAIKVDSLETEVRNSIKKTRPDLDTVWYNKGL